MKTSTHARKRTAATAPVPIIVTQANLERVQALARDLDAARELLRQAEADHAQAVASTMAALKSGATVEPGPRTAAIVRVPTKYAPSWKRAHCEHMAKCHAQAPETTEEQIRAMFPTSEVDDLAIGFANPTH